jgi:hypothetical protein
MSGTYAPGNRFQRRHAQDSQGKWHNLTRRQGFAEGLLEQARLARVSLRDSRIPPEDGEMPTSGSARRRAKAERNRLANSPQFSKVLHGTFGPLSPIKPVPNEAHPFFRDNPGDPRLFEYTVC